MPGWLKLYRMKTWVVLAALLVIGCVGADEDQPTDGMGGQMQPQGLGGHQGTGGVAGYTVDPAPDCTHELAQASICNTVTSVDDSGSYCAFCTWTASIDPPPAGGCAVRAQLTATGRHDILCVTAVDCQSKCRVPIN